MKKGNKEIFAKSVKSVYPHFEMAKRGVVMSHFNKNPFQTLTKPGEDSRQSLNNESILVKNTEEKGMKLYAVQENSRGNLGKRKREEHSDAVFIKRKIAKYEKIGYYRYSETDEISQESAFVLYDIGHDQLSYVPINKRLVLVRNKESFKTKPKIFIPGIGNLDDEEDEADLEWKSRFYNVTEREYKEKELKRKLNNIRKENTPFGLKEDLIPQEKLKNNGIKEVYSVDLEEEKKENEDDMDLVLPDENADEPQVS